MKSKMIFTCVLVMLFCGFFWQNATGQEAIETGDININFAEKWIPLRDLEINTLKLLKSDYGLKGSGTYRFALWVGPHDYGGDIRLFLKRDITEKSFMVYFGRDGTVAHVFSGPAIAK